MIKLGITRLGLIVLTFTSALVACDALEEEPTQLTASKGPREARRAARGGDGASITGTIGGTDGEGLRVRAEPNTTSAQVDSVWDGDVVTILCQTRGEHVDGTAIWNYIESPRGYVLDAYVRSEGRAKPCDGDEATGGGGGDEATGGGGGGNTEKTPKSTATSFSSIWGGDHAPITFGFLAPGDLYAYGTAYGLDGSGHTGIDVGLPFGTSLYAPMDAELKCAGTNDGPGTDGGGCAAFNDTGDGGAFAAPVGVGRIELLLDDGTVLIYGHSRTCDLRPGQRVKRGQKVGTSGGMRGAHIHVEARIRDGATPSGWRIVDPSKRLGS